jgi:hypothetical protein
VRTLRRLTLTLVTAVAILLAGASPALAYAPVDIVHTEVVYAGPYKLTVGFSTWPIRAMRSLDFTFVPDGGITGKSGTLGILGPQGDRRPTRISQLVRHPRKRDVWGLDVVALNKPGIYQFIFDISGPQGSGQGILNNLRVLDQPGPPLPLSWSIAALPLVALIGLVAVAWRRVRPGRHLKFVYEAK